VYAPAKAEGTETPLRDSVDLTRTLKRKYKLFHLNSFESINDNFTCAQTEPKSLQNESSVNQRLNNLPKGLDDVNFLYRVYGLAVGHKLGHH